MNRLNRLAMKYPKLDLACLQILQWVAEEHGLACADIANLLNTDHNYVHYRVNLMAGGIKGREKYGMDLINTTPDPLHHKRQLLSLTKAGKEVIQLLKPFMEDKQ